MKVCFVSSAYKEGTQISPFVYEQGESVARQGCTVVHYLTRGAGFKKYLNHSDFLNFVEEHKPDIVHAHLSYNGYLAGRKNKLPLVTSFMGGDILRDPDDPFYRHYINKFINYYVCQRSDQIICKSAELKHKLGKPASSAWIIPNGVGLSSFYPLDKNEAKNQLGLNLNKRYVLFPANPEFKNKNIALARETMALLKASDVDFLPVYNVPYKDLNLYYNASDALLFTSLTEGSPNVVKEAMATNLPIVSVKVGDTEERLNGVQNSYLCGYNATELLQALTKVLDSGRVSNGRQAIVNQGLDIDTTAKKIVDVYKKIIR